jgi:hypothetical protein
MMEPTIHVQPGPIHLEQEGFLHYLAREGRVALRWVIGISLVATLAVMVSPFLFLAPIPGLILVASYVLFILTREVERRSDRKAEAIIQQHDTAGESEEVMENAAEMHQLAPNTMRIVKRESRAGLWVLGVVMIIALILAFRFLPWEVVAIGAFVVTAYMIMVAWPVLLGWIEHDIEVQQGAHEPVPPSPEVHDAQS